jgi:DNA-binding MarR family transcriptional regulator
MKETNPRQYVRIPMSLLTTDGVKASTIATYASLASYADRKGFSFPSVSSIAKRAGLSEKVARRECNRLVYLGYLERKAHFDATDGQRSNRYVLTWQRDDIEEKTLDVKQKGKSAGVDLATPPTGESATLTKSIINQRQQSILAGDIVADSWNAKGKTQRKESVIGIVRDALENGISEEELRNALVKLNKINIYVSAYSLNTTLYPQPRGTLNADRKVDWSLESEDL